MANPFFTEHEMTHLRNGSGDWTERYSLPRFRKMGRPVYLFGCGNLAPSVKEHFRELDIRGFLDNNPARHGDTAHGLPIYPPNETAGQIRRENGMVIIGIFDELVSRQVEGQCRALGLDYIHYYDTVPIPTGVASTPDFAEDPDVIRGMDIWDEERSREYYRKLVRFRITMDPSDRPEVFAPQYFIEEIPATYLRNFIDVGAFDGDTLQVYQSLFGSNYDNYHAFEPLARFRPGLLESARNDTRIHVHACAVSDRNGKTIMADAGCDSRMDSMHGVEVPVHRLDDVLGEYRVGFIKMDIEGMEPAALRGAEKTIRRDQPVLAISIYHEPEHFYSIPRWIRGLDLGYRLLLRHHTRLLPETICYALPI